MDESSSRSTKQIWKRVFSPSTFWKAAVLSCMLVVAFAITHQVSPVGSPSPGIAALKLVIEGAVKDQSFLLTDGTLIISSENLEGFYLPDTVGGVRVKVLSPTQIQDLADATTYFYYLSVDEVGLLDSVRVEVKVNSYQAMSRIRNYQTASWQEMNASVDVSHIMGNWVAVGALIDLTYESNGVGSRISLAIASPAS